MFGAGSVGSYIRKRDRRGSNTAELDLSFFSRLFKTLHCHLIICQVKALLFFEFAYKPIDDPLIEIISAESVVTGSCKDLLNAVAHINNRYIKGAAAEVIDHDLLLGFFINTVRESGSSRLIDDPFNFKAGNLARVFGRLSL